MKYTNNHNLPEPLCRAIMRDTYRKAGHISVTALAKPPQMAYLERQHEDEIEVDVSEEIWMLLGTSVHAILERAGMDNALMEERLRVKCKGWTVAGKPDLYEADGTLTDFKVTSVYSFLLGDKPDWEAQLNCYALLLRVNGFEVKRLQILAILRDWTKSRALAQADYPKAQALGKPIPLWPHERTRAYMEERVKLHQDGIRGVFPECTEDERWHKDDKWAVRKKGNKRALRVLPSEWDAENYLMEHLRDKGMAPWEVYKAGKKRATKAFEHKQDAEDWAEAIRRTGVDSEVKRKDFLEIDFRPGEDTRCEHFCKVRDWCPQYAKCKAEAA
jgi:hypothetical protein